MNAALGSRTLRYSIFVAGLALAVLSFFVILGNAMTMEGRSPSVETLGLLGLFGGSVVAASGMIMGALSSRSLVPLAIVMEAGLLGAMGGEVLGSLMDWNSAWLVAVPLTPIGMWLGLLAGANATPGRLWTMSVLLLSLPTLLLVLFGGPRVTASGLDLALGATVTVIVAVVLGAVATLAACVVAVLAAFQSQLSPAAKVAMGSLASLSLLACLCLFLSQL